MDLLDPSSLPPGFGFHPTDIELISHYLKRKVLGSRDEMEVIPVVDIYKYEPWDLPAKSRIPSREGKWHFFNTRDRKYPNGFRSNRATEKGYWKSTGKDRVIRVQKRAIGTKKTLVFHQGRPPRGKRTEWIMHEYYLDDNEYKNAANAKDMYVICRVTRRTGLAPETDNNGDQAEKEESPLPLEEISAEASEEDTSQLSEHIAEPQTLSKAEFDAWLNELYDPNFSGMSAPTHHIKLEVDSALFAPESEPEVLSHTAYASGNQLLAGTIDDNNNNNNFAELNFDLLASQLSFGEMNPAAQQVNFSGLDDIFDYNLYFDAADLIETCQNGSNEHGPLGTTSETGIQIRERSHETFAEPTGHRIRLQVHKMEAPNNGPVNETHVFISDDHHLEAVDLGKETASADVKTKDAPVLEESKILERNTENKPYRRASQHHSPNNYEQRYTTTGYAVPNGFPSYYGHQCNQTPDTKASKHRFTRDSRLRDDVKRIFQGARKEARSIIHRYTSVARQCLLIGTCLVGGTAWSSFMQEAF